LSCGRWLCQAPRVTVFFGDKRRFAVEVGDWDGPALRRVDLWAAGQWLTCDDNMAFVRQFGRAVAGSATWLRSGHGTASRGEGADRPAGRLLHPPRQPGGDRLTTRGRSPVFFVHPPDNAEALTLARRLQDDIRALVPEVAPLPDPVPSGPTMLL
jgi:hypothetical protein